MNLKPHPAADCFPLMDKERLAELVDDIRKHGQMEPITICDGMIIDGRNRYAACVELGITPTTRQHRGDPWLFAWSLNGARRDLEATVRALIYRRCVKGSKRWNEEVDRMEAEANRKRAAAAKAGKVGRAAAKSLVVDHDDPPLNKPRKKHVARETMAAEAKVSPATMGRAEQIAQRKDLEKKVVNGEMKPAEAIRQIRADKKRKALKAAAKSAEAEERGRPSWSILNVDVLDGLESVRDEHGPARLIFADPPYNIGIDYGAGKKADMLPPHKYMDWASRWLGLCWDCLSDDGSLWVMIGDEYAAEYCVAIKEIGFTVRSWVKWYETFGVNCTDKFNRTSRHIFYAVKNEKRAVFNKEPVTRPSDRQTKYNDRRASAGGKLWDDVWQIPRLTGTCAERIPDFPTQLPLALVEPIVLCASMPGDLVVDPFNGSGTTGVAAIRNGRAYVGIEKSEKFAELADTRLRGT